MLNLNVWQPIQIYLINTNDSGIGNNTVGLTIHTALRNCGIFAPTTVLMLTLPILWLKYWLQLTACTWLFLITVLECSGRNERACFFFQISAKNKGISRYGTAVAISVKTQERGKNHASVIYMFVCMYVCITYFWD